MPESLFNKIAGRHLQLYYIEILAQVLLSVLQSFDGQLFSEHLQATASVDWLLLSFSTK